MTYDEIVKSMVALRTEIRELNVTIKEKETELTQLGEQLLVEMDLHGLSSLRVDNATISISETTRPGINDWDAFFAYVRDNDASYLIERRPAIRACQELRQQGTELPGIYYFTQRKPNLRVLNHD
jgi:hypothetical protein